MKNLKCYIVGDSDYVAALNEQQALEIMDEICGEGTYEINEVCEIAGQSALMDVQWVDEDDHTIEVGNLRKWLNEATEPKWLVGTEG